MTAVEIENVLATPELHDLFEQAEQHGSLRYADLIEVLEPLHLDPLETDAVFRELEQRGIEVRTGVRVDGVGKTDIHLSDGTTIATHTLAWTAGITAAPVVGKLGLPTDHHGRIPTDAHMRVPGFENVWAVGDAAAVPDPANPGSPCPQTAQHAMRQGRRVADNVAAALGHGRSRPFTYKTMGMVVDLGHRKAVAALLGVNVRGLPAFVITRAYHLAALPGWQGQRLRLAFDWALDSVFRLDSAELGVTDRRPTPLGSSAPGEP